MSRIRARRSKALRPLVPLTPEQELDARLADPESLPALDAQLNDFDRIMVEIALDWAGKGQRERALDAMSTAQRSRGWAPSWVEYGLWSAPTHHPAQEDPSND